MQHICKLCMLALSAAHLQTKAQHTAVLQDLKTRVRVLVRNAIEAGFQLLWAHGKTV
jgi:hypothetical protein